MRLLNIGRRAVLDSGGGYVDVAAASDGLFEPDPQALFARWPELRDWAANLGKQVTVPCTFAQEDLGAPAPRPRQVFAVGLNYASHADETGMDTDPGHPLTFTKFPSCISGPYGRLPLTGPEVDWEVELVVVIGQYAHRIREVDAWKHVAGLTIGQDFSDRTVQLEGSPPQFSLGKSFPGFGPLGPALVTPDELDQPDDLALSCAVNGETVQQGRTGQMIHSVPNLITLLAEICSLQPGDVVFTGTPDGVGMGRNPTRFLKPGDTVVTTIEGLGSMEQRCVVAEEDRQ